MRKLILGATLLALASPVLAQDYSAGGYDNRSGYGDDRRDYDRDGDIDQRDLYLQGRDIDRDGDYDARDRYLESARGDRGYADRGYNDRGYADRRYDERATWTTGRILPSRYAAGAAWIVHPGRYGLPIAPRYTHWVRVRDNAVLVRNSDRRVLRVVPHAL